MSNKREKEKEKKFFRVILSVAEEGKRVKRMLNKTENVEGEDGGGKSRTFEWERLNGREISSHFRWLAEGGNKIEWLVIELWLRGETV